MLLMRLSGKGMEAYYDNAILLTGITGILAMIPCLFFYRQDVRRRRLGGLVPDVPGFRDAAGMSGAASGKSGSIFASAAGRRVNRGHGLNLPEMLLLLMMGAGFSQYVNILVALFQNVLNMSEYQESMAQLMNGKSLWFLILCMGVTAPLAEEVVFRWLVFLRLRDYLKFWPAAVISALIFGIYHGNLVQAFYAGILGVLFAYFLEITGSLKSSVLLHMGANIWSLVWSELADRFFGTQEAIIQNSGIISGIMILLLAAMAAGTFYFQKSSSRKRLI